MFLRQLERNHQTKAEVMKAELLSVFLADSALLQTYLVPLLGPPHEAQSIVRPCNAHSYYYTCPCILAYIRVFAEDLVALGFLRSVSYIKSIPTHEKLFAAGKCGPNAMVLGLLGWPWVGVFVGFIVILSCFPTQQYLVYFKVSQTP